MIWPDVSTVDDISPHQREKLAIATSGPFGILGGNPGAGKTRTISRLIRRLLQIVDPSRIGVCSFTGKAAIRITEELFQAGIENVAATTIHRLLQVTRNGHDGEGWGFGFNENRPLPLDFVICDEVSMNDTYITASLFAAIPDTANTLFAGDWGQLPPVGVGAPMRDFIAAGVPYGELTEIHRNAGDIVRVCRELKDKNDRVYRPSPKIDPDNGMNCFHIETRSPQQTLDIIEKMLSGECFGLDRKWDVQVLCARNGDTTSACRDPLNLALQRILNPGDASETYKGMRVGDKVICTTNGMYPVVGCKKSGCKDVTSIEWQIADKRYQCPACGSIVGVKDMTADFVANGEMGEVSYINKDAGFMHVSFDAPRRTVRFAGEFTSAIELGYAVTCHKFQGSQCKIVIVVADDGAGRVTSWEWHRTAISRAQWLCVTVGKVETIRRQCQTSALIGRKTFLCEQLKSGLLVSA